MHFYGWWFLMYHHAGAAWSVRSSPDRAIRVRALAGTLQKPGWAPAWWVTSFLCRLYMLPYTTSSKKRVRRTTLTRLHKFCISLGRENEGSGKLCVVELLVIGADGIARGATVRVITNQKPILLSRPVHMKALSTRVSKRMGANTDTLRS